MKLESTNIKCLYIKQHLKEPVNNRSLKLFSLKINFEISFQTFTNMSFNYKQKEFDNDIKEEIDDNLGELEAQIEDFPEFYS